MINSTHEYEVWMPGFQLCSGISSFETISPGQNWRLKIIYLVPTLLFRLLIFKFQNHPLKKGGTLKKFSLALTLERVGIPSTKSFFRMKDASICRCNFFTGKSSNALNSSSASCYH